MTCTLHNSKKLVELFSKKPWQGADPFTAKYLFIGKDANYDENIEEILPEIWDYIDDGVKWWKENKLHHPLLLDKYRGKGKLYHTGLF